MWMRAIQALSVLTCLALTSAAQEGHPLTGTWTGDWGPTTTERNHLTLVMEWDGEEIRGVINPGPNSIPIDAVFVDVTDWTVRFEAQTTRSGAPVEIGGEGRLEDLGSYHRTWTGIWREGEVEGDFRLTRD